MLALDFGDGQTRTTAAQPPWKRSAMAHATIDEVNPAKVLAPHTQSPAHGLLSLPHSISSYVELRRARTVVQCWHLTPFFCAGGVVAQALVSELIGALEVCAGSTISH